MPSPELAALARHILDTHHAFLHRELPRLAEALSGSTRQIIAPFHHLHATMDEHMMKEEAILYPAIIALAERGEADGCGIAGPIQQMSAEHDQIRTLEAALRSAARDAGPHEADLLAMLDDLSEHARIEDEELFPTALALAGAALEQEAIQHEAAKPPAERRVLRATRGYCPDCREEVPAQVVVRDGTVQLEKICPTHGVASQLLSRQPEYWGELDDFYFKVNSKEHPQRDYIVRMTERCNLACPICLAKANTEDTPDLDLGGLERLISSRRGIKVDLMAAEPTLRPDLLDWVRKVKASGNIAALHTNGINLTDAAYVAALAEAGVDEVFLQFDGLNEAANIALRGRPLIKARKAALANLRKHNIATSLIVVIARGLNEEQVGATFRFALQPENDHVREVFFLGLRSMGSARQTGVFPGQQLMPDEIIDLLTTQEPALRREDIKAFNMAYFAMLSALSVRKCLYVQHYLVARGAGGTFTPISDVLDMPGLAQAAKRYAARYADHPGLARAGLGAALIRQGLRPDALRMGADLVRLEHLFANGMNLSAVPKRFLLLGFITACDLDNFDSGVAVNCGKGELSADGGFASSSAQANVEREARFADTDRTPGPPSTRRGGARPVREEAT